VAPVRPGDHVVVVGAGPAGLTAAYLLAGRGHAVTVVEGSDAFGGISRTVCYKGYRFDIGGHRFFTKIAPVQALWDELLGEEFIDVPRLSRIHYRGRYFHYPLRPASALAGLGVVDAARIVLSYVRARLRPSSVEDTFEQWVSNRFGRRLYEIFFKTYTEKVWGIPCTEIRAEWAAQRIQGLSLARAILSATALHRRSVEVKTLIHSFKYPRLGPGQVWEACAYRVRARGGTVLLGHMMTDVELRGGRAVAVVAETAGGRRRIDADHVISTTDIRALVRALGGAVDPATRDAAAGLAYRDFLVVALILDCASPFPDTWIYVHTPGVKVGRVQNFNNWSAAMVPDAGRTCIGMEYFCSEHDALWSAADADLVALAGRELQALGLARRAHVVDGTVVRVRKAYPVYDAMYRARLDCVRAFIDRIPNLHTIGRNGMHKHNNQDHSMYTAMLAVENMYGTTHDVWAVNTDFEYHEGQRLDRPAAGTRPPVAPPADFRLSGRVAGGRALTGG
jgi:protoporphyrinogen oxidase